MSATKDTLEKMLNKNAQEVGYLMLSSSLGLEAESTKLEEIYDQVSNEAIKWVAETYQVEENELLKHIKNQADYKEEFDEASTEYFKINKAFFELYKPYVALTNEISKKRNRIYFTREETEQNAWRMAYFIKEMRMSELQKKHNEPIDNEQLLLGNLTDEDMQSIEQSFQHIKIGLANIYAWQDFISFLSEYFELEHLTNAIETDAPSEAPTKALRAEAGHIQQFISEHAFTWTDNDNTEQKVIGTTDEIIDIVNHYAPLLYFASLLDIKRTNKKDYKEITNNYFSYTVTEITENLEDIMQAFSNSIIDNLAEQDEGAK